MTEREKLVGIMGELPFIFCDLCGKDYLQNKMLLLADHLIANGVTVREDCEACAEKAQKCIEGLQEQIADMQKKQEWISVRDRLPEKDVDVLVCDRRNNVFVAAVCASDYFSTGLSWRDQTGYLIGNLGIVSWQPLPKAKKEEQP